MCADLPMGDLVDLQWLHQWVIVVIKAFRRHIKAHMPHIEGLQSCFYLFAQGKGE